MKFILTKVFILLVVWLALKAATILNATEGQVYTLFFNHPDEFKRDPSFCALLNFATYIRANKTPFLM